MLLKEIGGMLSLKKLIRMANKLDLDGLHKEADILDDVIKKVAVTEKGDYIYLSQHTTPGGTGLFAIGNDDEKIYVSIDNDFDMTLEDVVLNPKLYVGIPPVKIIPDNMVGNFSDISTAARYVLDLFIAEADGNPAVLDAVKKASQKYNVPIQIPSSSLDRREVPYLSEPDKEKFISNLTLSSSEAAKTSVTTTIYRVGSPDSDKIENINRSLKDMNFDVELGTKYSRKTEAAVKKFQSMVNSDDNYTGSNITVDGLAGPVTLKILFGTEFSTLRESIKSINAAGGVGEAVAKSEQEVPVAEAPAVEAPAVEEDKVQTPGSYVVIDKKTYDDGRSIGIMDLDPKDTMKYEDLNKRFKFALSTSGPNGPFGIAKKNQLSDEEHSYLKGVRDRLKGKTRIDRGQRKTPFRRRR